ncbi:hypothetical protein KC367_g95 [Hortaea werneckii]|nr:hypothetical protein KC367_g95 [Hortaea werneckii]
MIVEARWCPGGDDFYCCMYSTRRNGWSELARVGRLYSAACGEAQPDAVIGCPRLAIRDADGSMDVALQAILKKSSWSRLRESSVARRINVRGYTHLTSPETRRTSSSHPDIAYGMGFCHRRPCPRSCRGGCRANTVLRYLSLLVNVTISHVIAHVLLDNAGKFSKSKTVGWRSRRAESVLAGVARGSLLGRQFDSLADDIDELADREVCRDEMTYIALSVHVLEATLWMIELVLVKADCRYEILGNKGTYRDTVGVLLSNALGLRLTLLERVLVFELGTHRVPMNLSGRCKSQAAAAVTGPHDRRIIRRNVHDKEAKFRFSHTPAVQPLEVFQLRVAADDTEADCSE